MTALTPVTSIPAVAPDHATLAGKVYNAGLGATLHARVTVSLGTGACTLLRYDYDAAEWHPWGADATAGGVLGLDATVRGGQAHGAWDIGRTGGGDFMLLVTGGPTVTSARVGQVDL